MLKLKIDVLEALKEKGITYYSVRKTKCMAQSTLVKLKAGVVPTGAIDQICGLLQCQPGDILEWVPDKAKEE